MTNKEARKRAQKRWYEKNRESILEKRKRHYQENLARLRQYGREYDRKKRLNKSSRQKDTTSNRMTAALKQILEQLSQY